MYFQIWHEEFCEFSPIHSKVPKFHFNGILFSKVFEVWAKKYRGVIHYDTEKCCKIWINPDLVISKMAWGIERTFIRSLKSLKNYTLMDSFCPKHIFQLENFRETMYHDTEGWCKILKQADLWLEQRHKEFG